MYCQCASKCQWMYDSSKTLGDVESSKGKSTETQRGKNIFIMKSLFFTEL